MKILVTGSNGMLGRNICEGIPSIGISRQTCDLTNEDEVQFLLEDQPDVIIHCAAEANNSKGPSYLNNTRMTHNLTKHARDCHFIFISSSTVYGDCKRPFEDSPKNPTSLYGLSKIHCEELVSFYAGQNGFNYTILRPCAIVGPHLTHGLLKDLIKKIKAGGPIELWGQAPGSIKPFLHVSDLIEVIRVCIKDKVSGILNVSSEDNMSVLEVAMTVMQQLGTRDIQWNPSKVPAGDNNEFLMGSNSCVSNFKYNSRQAIRRAIEENA